MRDDTRIAFERFHDKGQLKRVWKQTALIEDLESRLSPERQVKAGLYTVGHGGPGGSEVGILLLSDYGLHWKGENRGSARLDLPWSSLRRAEVIEARSGGFDRVIESGDPYYELRFRLYEDSDKAAFVRQLVNSSQPLL
jgi:hypothetical protein